MATGTRLENQLLLSLPAADLEVLQNHVRKTVLSSRSVICEPGEAIRDAYFPSTAAISMVVVVQDGQLIETAMVGRDGMVGAMSVLHGRPEFGAAIVQIEGAASTIDAKVLRKLANEREAIRSMLLQGVYALNCQTRQIAACNASHGLEQRLCRWLLRASDACGKRTIATTQESIAEMLGVKRTSVSLVAHGLQTSGLIKNHRGQIELLDMDALAANACGCHVAIKASYAQSPPGADAAPAQSPLDTIVS